MSSSPSILPRNGLPSPLRSTPIGFQTRPTAQLPAQPVQGQDDSGQDSFALEGPGRPSRPPEASPQPDTGNPLLSVVLGRALPATAGPTDFSDRNGAPGSTLVVIEQPDQPAEVQVQGALSAYPPPSTIGDSSDNRDGFDAEIETHPTLGSRLAWYFRILGVLGGTALIVPGALMLAISNQTEVPQGTRVHFFSKFLSGFMITGGSVITALATLSGLKAIQPSLSSRIASSLRARFQPRTPSTIQLPPPPLEAPAMAGLAIQTDYPE